MKTLLTKVQYNDYEPGEYTDIAERSYEETVALINSFNWEEQRHNTPVKITGPSISVESEEGVLKLGTYYDSKFIIRWLTANNKRYDKIVPDLQTAFTYVHAFYNSGLSTVDMQRKSSMFVKNSFITKPFLYQRNLKRALLQTIKGNTILGLPFICIGIYFLIQTLGKKNAPLADYLPLLAPFLVGLILTGINGIILLNQYNYERGKQLVISRGKDIFLYGVAGDLRKYQKTKIDHVEILNSTHGKHLFSNNEICIIHFKDGNTMQTTNLLISQTTLHSKMPLIPFKYVNIRFFPKLIKKAALKSVAPL